MNTTKPEKVGVLLVHGVGEQCQFEHLEGEARNIATTLRKSAAQTNRKYVATAFRNLVTKTTDKNLKTALEAAAQKIDKGNIATALKELVAKTNDENFKTGVNELAERIDKGSIATALKSLVEQIPELTKFELAELAAKKLANKAQVIQIAVNSFPSAAFGSEQETWHDGSRSPVMVEVYDEENNKNIRITQIYFHQVWWADLDEPTNLWSEIRFWFWGLSLWTIKRKFKTGLPGSERMDWPNNGQKNQTTISGWARVHLRLFWVSLVILLTLPVLSLLNFVLRGLLAFNIPRPDILAQFIGDVKLFQQEKRIGKGPLQDLGLPPRVTLRRRMIRGLVEMALRRYHRWYILAHSQGTVLAFNGIMETAQSLPNYLTTDLWRRCIAKSLRRDSLIREAQTDQEKLTDEEKRKMQPSFPSWRDKDYILDRRELFKNLRGLLTYGSPLSKFAALWPAIVPLNRDKYVFHKDFQWLNVYDPTDPVAGATQPFQSQPSQSDKSPSEVTTPEFSNYKAAEPVDFAYKANRFHLLSHIEYLAFREGDRTRLVDIVANWLLEGNLTVNKDEGMLTVDTLTVKQGETPSWLNPSLTLVYEIARETTWVFAALLLGSLLSVIISAVPQLSSHFQPIISFAFSMIPPWLQLSLMPLWFKSGIATVFFIGVFSLAISLIVGTRFVWGGFVLGLLTTAVITVIFSSIQEELLMIILTALFEGVFYILLGVIVVFIIGALVWLGTKLIQLFNRT